MDMRAAGLALLSLSIGLTYVRADWHDVAVGFEGPEFAPASIIALPHDAIHFIIPSPNIAVVQSRGLDAPCTPLPGGFRSIDGLGKVDVTILDDSPVYAYADPHCTEGMVFVANARSSGDLATLVRNARALASAPEPEPEPKPKPKPGPSASDTEPSPTETKPPTDSTDLPTQSESEANATTPRVPLTNASRQPHTTTTTGLPTSSGPVYDERSPGHTGQTGTPQAAPHGASKGLLAGVVVGCVAGTALLILLAGFLFKRYRRRRRDVEPLFLPTSEPTRQMAGTSTAHEAAGAWRKWRKGDREEPPAYMPS